MFYFWFLTTDCFVWSLPFNRFVGHWFHKYTAVASTSAQKDLTSPESANIGRSISINVLFNLSAIPFCSGYLGMVNSCFIPSFLRYSSNSVEVYSPPLSVQRVFTQCTSDFSTFVFHSQNFYNTSLLHLITYTQTYLVLSLMNVTKYSAPLRDFDSSFPLMSLWTNSRGSAVVLLL